MTTSIRIKGPTVTPSTRTLFHVQETGTHDSKLPYRGTWAIQEEISTGKRATPVGHGNSTGGKDKAGSTIAALSTMAMEPARSKGLGSEDSVRGKHSPRDKKSTRLKVTEHADGADAELTNCSTVYTEQKSSQNSISQADIIRLQSTPRIGIKQHFGHATGITNSM